jgi:hypothetical protein
VRRVLWIPLGVAVLLVAKPAHAQTPPPIQADTLGMHNMSTASGSSVTSPGSLGCVFCHAPHSGVGGNTPLWNQTRSNQT